MISMVIIEYALASTHSRDGLARVLGFTDCDADQLGSEIGEDGGNHCTPQSEEAASTSSTLVLFKSSRRLPITEALPVAVGSASECENERKNDYATNDQNLDRREPKFEFSEEANAQIVDSDDSNEEDRNPNTWIDFIRWNPI
jgi:hypothetical protein